jgi:PKD repeat protein
MKREKSRKALPIFLVALMTLSIIPLLTTQARGETNSHLHEYNGAELQLIPGPFPPLNLTYIAFPLEASYMLYEHHGGTWSDAEKRPPSDGGGNPPPVLWGEEDDWLCWAATASNILEWTGWGLGPTGMWNTDEMLEYFMYYWNDTGGWMEGAWHWWFDGWDPGPPSKDVPGGGDFWTPPYNFGNYFHEERDDSLVLSAIDNWLRDGYGVGLGIFPMTPPGGHAITVWGISYSLFNSTDYHGIWVTDSDNSKGSTPPAPNLLKYYEVEWNGTHWYMPNYGSGWYISVVQALEPFPSTRPVAVAGGPYLGNEGSLINFDGSGSSDADNDTLQYRWDFDNDGVWDTAWSANAAASNTWYDDYTGTVLLQVYDGHMLDIDTGTVTVSNVAPIITVTGDTIDENGVATVNGTINDPSTLDTFNVTIDWGDGLPEVFSYPAGSTVFSETHQYLDDDPSGTSSDIYTVTVTVEDDDGGSDIESTTVTVNNLNPVVTLTLDQPNDQFILPTVHGLNFTGNFTDVGTLDTHTAVWDWGDSTTSGGTVVESGGSGTVTDTHTYSTPGVYTVTLTVTDDDTGNVIDTIEVTVVTVEEATHITNEYIQDLPDEAFTSNPKQRKKAFSNMFSAIDDMLADEEYQGVIQDLRNNVREKADGHVDGKLKNDWIIDMPVQTEICHKIDDITAYLETLL